MHFVCQCHDTSLYLLNEKFNLASQRKGLIHDLLSASITHYICSMFIEFHKVSSPYPTQLPVTPQYKNTCTAKEWVHLSTSPYICWQICG